jgi:hypothetical protein
MAATAVRELSRSQSAWQAVLVGWAETPDSYRCSAPRVPVVRVVRAMPVAVMVVPAELRGMPGSSVAVAAMAAPVVRVRAAVRAAMVVPPVILGSWRCGVPAVPVVPAATVVLVRAAMVALAVTQPCCRCSALAARVALAATAARPATAVMPARAATPRRCRYSTPVVRAESAAAVGSAAVTAGSAAIVRWRHWSASVVLVGSAVVASPALAVTVGPAVMPAS